MSAVVNILRFVVAFIDSIAVWLIKMIYGLFFQLTDIMLYSEDIVQGLGQRIGLILGIFMLFRLAVSLVTYLISPDKLNDNAKGGGKMLVNIIISLVLLATVNIIFVQAYKIQDVVIRSKFIEKIFFGSKAEVADTDISYYLYTPLFSPNEEAFNNLCADLWDPTTKIEDDEACDSKLYEILGDDRRAVYQAFNSQDMSIVLGNYNVVTAKSNGVYAFDYKYISPIAGIVCAIVLISFSMDLAVRAVKLLFLQIISPIPIISNIDPGKGQDMFKKWYQECFKTYISVFIRMITIDFAVFLITILLTNFKELFTSEPLLNVALVVGALIFAKQVPKLIEDMFGIKLDGMALHPLKKFQEQALFGKNITSLGAAGLAGGAVMGANAFKRIGGSIGDVGKTINAFRNDGFGKGMKSLGKGFLNFGYGIGSVATGGISAFSRGAVSSVKGEKFGQVYKGAYGGAISARQSRDNRRDSGVNFFEMTGSKITHAVGGSTKGDYVKSANDNLSKLQSAYKSMMAAAEGADDTYLIHGTGTLAGQTFNGMKGLAKFEEELKKTTINREDFTTDDEYLQAITDHRARLDEIDQMKKDRLDSIVAAAPGTSGANAATEKAIKEGYEQMQSYVDDINAATRQIDKDISELDRSKVPSKINGLSKGVSTQISINDNAAHAQIVDSFSANKNQK